MKDIITQRQALDYEIYSSWWAKYVFFEFGRELAGMYFAWKVKRKHAAYTAQKEIETKIENNKLITGK